MVCHSCLNSIHRCKISMTTIHRSNTWELRNKKGNTTSAIQDSQVSSWPVLLGSSRLRRIKVSNGYQFSLRTQLVMKSSHRLGRLDLIHLLVVHRIGDRGVKVAAYGISTLTSWDFCSEILKMGLFQPCPNCFPHSCSLLLINARCM